MKRPYVEWLRVENFRCVKSVDVHLTPLHAFIGPNDSGKSTLLRAIASSHATLWVKDQNGGRIRRKQFSGRYPTTSDASPPPTRTVVIAKAIEPSSLLRLDPDELRRNVQLVPTGEPLWFTNERGRGLPGLLDALVTRDVDSFLKLREQFLKLFPGTKALRLENPDAQSKAIGLTLSDGTEVSAAGMSEGMLYWLAFAVVEHLAPQAILLIEEPENGLHPARIAEVMHVLRAMSERTQIILATHSPLVINELEPEEVTIVTRTPERGTICTPMTATKNFEERKKVYALGELWLSYADGELEKELVPDSTENKAS